MAKKINGTGTRTARLLMYGERPTERCFYFFKGNLLDVQKRAVFLYPPEAREIIFSEVDLLASSCLLGRGEGLPF